MPIFVYEGRRDARSSQPFRDAGRINVKVSEDIGGQEPPDPVRSTDFNYQGKPLSHALSRVQVAVMGMGIFGDWGRDDFAGTKVELDPLVMPHSPAGLQHPFGVRPNISRPPAVAYGSLFTLEHSTYGILE